MPQFRAMITGHVQGVCFRAETSATARALGIRGYARNLPSGQVEVVAAAARPLLDELIAWLHHGPAVARVDEVTIEWDTDTPLGDGFEVRY
jgi:acylphosphatase